MPTAVLNISVLSIEDPDIAPFGLGVRPNGTLVGRLRNKALYVLVDHVIFQRVNQAYRKIAKKHGWPMFPTRPFATPWLFLQPSLASLEYPRAATPRQLDYIGALLPDRQA
jgi:hypothetical protein